MAEVEVTPQTISPEAFYEVFLAAAAAHGAQIYDASIEGNSTFTDVMFCILFEDVAKRLHCHSFREYYKFDCFFYRDKNLKHFPESSTYVKSIAVALEHENVPEKSVEEIHKLQLLNAPLKVLVTYPREPEKVKALLNDFAEIIGEADIFGDISTLKRQLVIFGFVAGAAFTWRGFVYRNGAFVEIGIQNAGHSASAAAVK